MMNKGQLKHLPVLRALSLQSLCYVQELVTCRKQMQIGASEASASVEYSFERDSHVVTH